MDKQDVDRWLERYIEAWETYDRERIADLFAEEVEYRYHPYDEPIRGRDAVVEAWVGEGNHEDASTPDEPGTYEASYRAVAVDGDTAVAVGTSSYRNEPGGPIGDVYDNCYVIRFASDGRCREFTEWYMKRPGG